MSLPGKVPMNNVRIVPARSTDVPVILSLIRALGDYERLSNEVVATEESLRTCLFGERPAAEVVLAYVDETVVGFALFFQNFSTFLGRPGTVSRRSVRIARLAWSRYRSRV